MPDAPLCETPEHVMLICTVGGSHEPLVESIKHWKPARAIFIPTAATRDIVNGQVLPAAAAAGVGLGPGACRSIVLPDEQNFAGCVRGMRELEVEVREWLGRGEGYRVAVDMTGGTKPMSAALALRAHRWLCHFSYVGGARRTKEGTGVVVTGSEKVLHTDNPWNALGYQAVEDACTLFNRGAYSSADAVLETALKAVDDPAAKRELATLQSLARAYGAWDRFEHRAARTHLDKARKNANDLRSLFDPAPAEAILRAVEAHHAHLAALDGGPPGRATVLDLLANANRRARDERFDDAVARLYRGIEALAQIRLRDEHHINADAVAVDALPAPLRERWGTRGEQGPLKLGLQDDYLLLAAMNDPLGQQFVQAGLADAERSPLSSRNQSILAHGFQPVGSKVFQQLWRAALALAASQEADLPTFITLGEPDRPAPRLQQH